MDYGQFTQYAKRADDSGATDLAKRIRAEGTACAALIDAILAKGAKISVNDGEEWTVKGSTDKGEVIRALFTTDSDIIRARDADNAVLGNFYLLYGNSGAEVIGDYSDNDFCNAIWEEIAPTLDKLEA